MYPFRHSPLDNFEDSFEISEHILLNAHGVANLLPGDVFCKLSTSILRPILTSHLQPKGRKCNSRSGAFSSEFQQQSVSVSVGSLHLLLKYYSVVLGI